VTEPSTDEREARAKTLRDAFDVAFMGALDRGAGRDERLDISIAAVLAAHPAVDVEGIAAVLREHRTTSHMGGRQRWTVTCGCEWISGPLPIGEDDEAHRNHQAAAVVAYLAGEGRG